jgi:hypothetical protein
MFRKVTLCLFIIAVVFTLGLASPASRAKAASDTCASIAGISGVYNSGDTNGTFGTINAGEVVSVTISLGTATTGSFRIVGDPAGAITLGGPGAIPGTLTFSGTLPSGAVGIGFFIDSANGTVIVTASCSGGDEPRVPAGFVQKKVICDVLVYGQPDLNFPTTAKLRNGQTWYVDPKTVTGKDKKQWYVVYVGSHDLGFIPASCVKK